MIGKLPSKEEAYAALVLALSGTVMVLVAKGDFHGEVILPGDDGYDEVRKVFNGMIDRLPTLIARCVDTSDKEAIEEYELFKPPAPTHSSRLAVTRSSAVQ